ncbi:MAG TPA: hypothetical protein VGS41_03255, partial [Chthonomonadales bacterium]|nr:hypothetical protein [Chthonomonadales bacterium]
HELAQIGLTAAEAQQIARQFLLVLWERRHWARLARAAYLKRCISGLGAIAYLWDDRTGPVLEHVRTPDLAIDPHVTDWTRLRWAARRIRLPREEARERYGELAAESGLPERSDFVEGGKSAVDLWIYWDADTEAVLSGNQVVSREKNLYRRVPLRFIQGDINPESEFPLGDYTLATGAQQLLTDLQDLINSQARHGGGIGWYRPEAFEKADQEALQSGHPQGFVGVTGMPGVEAVGYVPAEPINQAVLECLRMGQQGLDAITGVSEFQRGVVQQRVRFATEAALLANQSGARGTQARIEYEKFVEELARDVLWMSATFARPHDQDERILWSALSSVKDVSVLEQSTAFKDPAFEMQSSIQLLQVMAPYIQGGVVNPRPLIQDVFRAFGKRDVDKYLVM